MVSAYYIIGRKLDNKIFIYRSCTVHIWRSRLVLAKFLARTSPLTSIYCRS